MNIQTTIESQQLTGQDAQIQSENALLTNASANIQQGINQERNIGQQNIRKSFNNVNVLNMHLQRDDQKGSDLSSKNFNISMIKDSKRNQSHESHPEKHRESNMERNTHRSKDSPELGDLSKDASKGRKDDEIIPFDSNTPLLGKVGNLNTEHSEQGNKSPLSNSRMIIEDCKIKKSTGPSPNMS